MTERNDSKQRRRPGRWGWWAAVAGVTALVWGATSCTTVSRTVMVPPEVPGAAFVGSKACEECHEEVYKEFMQTADHARLMAKGPNALHMGCESCHGPGSLHVESGGERKPPSHAPLRMQQITDTQRPISIINPKRSPENCFACHLDKRGQFQTGHHHPVPEGKMSCSDCHDPHKGSAHRGGIASGNNSDACVKCHEAQHGPFVFEHQAMREGCTTCHDPHGSVNPKMLVARNANLCLKCHFQQVTPGKLLIGGVDHKTSIQQGACWSAGCHEAVHGSRVNASLRF